MSYKLKPLLTTKYTIEKQLKANNEKLRETVTCDRGIALEITLTKTNGGIKIKPLKYEPFWVLRYQTAKGYIFRMILVNYFIAHPKQYLLINEQAKSSMIQFYNDTKQIIGM